MRNPAIKIKKQSLVDWQVTLGGSHIAWIEKNRAGYTVRYQDESYDLPSFKAASDFVKEEADNH